MPRINWQRFERHLRQYERTLKRAEGYEALGDSGDELDADMKLAMYGNAMRCYAAIGDPVRFERIRDKAYAVSSDFEKYEQFNLRWFGFSRECEALLEQQKKGRECERRGDCQRGRKSIAHYLEAYAWYGGADDWLGMARIASKLGLPARAKWLGGVALKPTPSEEDIRKACDTLVHFTRLFCRGAKNR